MFVARQGAARVESRKEAHLFPPLALHLPPPFSPALSFSSSFALSGLFPSCWFQKGFRGGLSKSVHRTCQEQGPNCRCTPLSCVSSPVSPGRTMPSTVTQAWKPSAWKYRPCPCRLAWPLLAGHLPHCHLRSPCLPSESEHYRNAFSLWPWPQTGPLTATACGSWGLRVRSCSWAHAGLAGAAPGWVVCPVQLPGPPRGMKHTPSYP